MRAEQVRADRATTLDYCRVQLDCWSCKGGVAVVEGVEHLEGLWELC